MGEVTTEALYLPTFFVSPLYRTIKLIKISDYLLQIGEARALYNLGNVYHAKGKHFGRSFHQDPGEFPEEVQSSLERAVEFYE